MQLVKTTTKQRMYWEMLRHEVAHKPEKREQLYEGIPAEIISEKTTRKVIENPSFSSQEENHFRRSMIDAVRPRAMYRITRDSQLYEAVIDVPEIANLYGCWCPVDKALSGGSFRIDDIARNVSNNVTIEPTGNSETDKKIRTWIDDIGTNYLKIAQSIDAMPVIYQRRWRQSETDAGELRWETMDGTHRTASVYIAAHLRKEMPPLPIRVIAGFALTKMPADRKGAIGTKFSLEPEG